MSTKVKMTHPELDTEIEVSESAVPFHMASGWKPVDGKVAKAEAENVPADMVAESDTKPAKRASKES